MDQMNQGLLRSEGGYALVGFLALLAALGVLVAAVFIAVLGVVMAVVTPNLTAFVGRGELQSYHAEKRWVQTVIDVYIADNRVAAFVAAGNIKNGDGPDLAAVAPGAAPLGSYFLQAVKWCWKYSTAGLVTFEPSALNCNPSPPAQPAGGT
ncbi:MAG: hypothetical protein HYY02_10045 [Chloroflexi bacterium]|nr:hypothetical protein [Chloroflexota bacterium]